jgi:outer membrane biogenesis lipoprotein LolB
MKKAVLLISALAMLAACNDTTATPDTANAEGGMPATSQQDEVAKQKLTIEQAAGEATKLIEADAKAEIETATPAPAEPAQ